MQTTTEQSTFTTPSDREAVLSRTFEAPRQLVIKTILDPELIPDWWGPKRMSARVDRWEVRPGGQWRLVLRDSVSRVFAFHGTFQEIVPPDRVIYTFEFEGYPGHTVLETAEFEDLGGEKTRVTFTSLFESPEDRDAALKWGVRDGALQTADRLDRLLKRCSAPPRSPAAGTA